MNENRALPCTVDCFASPPPPQDIYAEGAKVAKASASLLDGSLITSAVMAPPTRRT
jgi:hypothetical protein